MTIAMILQGRDDEVVQIPPSYTVRGVATLLTEKRIGAVPVMEGDRVVGILSERDIVRIIASDGHAALDWPVERVMTRTPTRFRISSCDQPVFWVIRPSS